MPNHTGKANSRINKQKEIEQRKRKKRKIKLIIILLIVIITAICIYLLTSERYNIKNIEIEGNEELTNEQIKELSGIKIGDNIFSTLEVVVRVKLKENGYDEDVKVKKKYPNSITIQITERKKAYQILTETECYIYIDEQGYILDYSLNKLDVTTITGMSITETEIQNLKRLGEKDLEKMEKILHINDEAKKINIAQDIQQIDVKEEYVLHLQENKIIINLGDATNLSDRMFYVKAILKEENNNSGTIYVNGNINEGFAPYFSAK
jgi:cell division protein FtsQ